MSISLSPFAPENLVPRDGFGSPVPRQPAHLHTQAESSAYLRDSSRVPRRRLFSYLNHHAPSGQSRVYRVTQMRTDGVHCRESAGTGPVNHKVVPNGCCLGRSPWTNEYAPLFPTSTIGISGHVESTGVMYVCMYKCIFSMVNTSYYNTVLYEIGHRPGIWSPTLLVVS